MSFQEKMQYLGTHTSFVVICRITLSKELNKYAIEHYTSPIAELLFVKNGSAIVVCGFLMK